MPRTPVPVRTGRSFGDILRAVAAFIALAVLLVGVPGALAYFIGWPLPRSVPSLDMLRQDISFGVFVKALALAVWIAWAQFTACVLVEVKAAISGVGMPARVPGAGPSQLLARNLVAALLLVSASAASFVPAIGQIGMGFGQQPAPGAVAVAPQSPGQQEAGGSGGQERSGTAERDDRAGQTATADRADRAEKTARADKSEKAERDTKFYRIQPPEGRHHDTLWEISERHLDDGLRYKEIYELNKDRVQPDGSKLTEASLIRPGWIMEMPADAHGGELVEMPDEARQVGPELREQIDRYQKTGDNGGDTGGAERTQQTETRQPAETPTPTPEPEERPAEQPAQEASEGGSFSASSFGLPEALIGAPLLAAGLLGALGRRRRRALWQAMSGALGRGVGDEFAPPAGSAADARDALLVGADPDAVRFLDRALRGLSAGLAADGRRLPAVYAAWLGESDLHLQLAAPAGQPPAPWRLGQAETFWTIDRTDAGAYEDTDGGTHDPLVGIAAPYPGLVSLGMREGVRLLLNLESVPGIVSVTGADGDRTAVLASVAAELATSGWSDRMTVTLVGFGEELTTLAPTRVRHVEDLPGLLEVMEAETNLRRDQLRGAGQDSVLTGRAGPVQHQQWAPHLVLVGAEPTQEETERLAALAAGSDALGIGYLVGTGQEELLGAVWEFGMSADGKLSAPVMGLELDAQLLPEALRAAVVELFADTDADPADAEPGDAEPDDGERTGRRGGQTGPGFTVDLSEQGRPAVYARLMGPYEILGVEEPEGTRSPLLHEALALLLLHREGVHPQVLASGLWPRGVTDDVRDALIERLKDWLGTGPEGQPLLRADETGRLVLAASVVSDWDVLRTLHHETEAGEGLVERPSPPRRQRLKEALELARGPLLADRAEGRYGWLAHEIVETQHPILVADVGLALAAEYLAADKPKRAAFAVRTALSAAPTDERLWNELLRATYATGDEAQLTAAARWLTEVNRRVHGSARGLPSRTEALLDELMPTWRSAVAGADSGAATTTGGSDDAANAG